MKNKWSLLLTLPMLFSLASCDGNNPGLDLSDKVEITFELNGGTYANSTDAVKHYYSKKSGGTYIVELNAFDTKSDVEKAGYELKGWYRTMTANPDGTFTFDGKFDFQTEKVSGDKLTLYAKWGKPYNYTYQLYYKDASNQLIPYTDANGEEKIDTVSEGDIFDYETMERTLDDITVLNYYDEQGNPWNKEFKHPGGEGDCTIKVVMDYIDGIFKIVTTAKELTSATSSNIYLANDIDLAGAEINFGNYKKKFYGNNHVISNAKIKYNASTLVNDYDDGSANCLYISLFGNTKDAEIKDVTFTNVVVDVTSSYSKTARIYVSPIASSIVNSTITNVSINGTITISRLPRLASGDVLSHDELYIKNTTGYVSINDETGKPASNVSISCSMDIDDKTLK